MGSFRVLGLGLSGVRIDMCWNFNGCRDFCGGEIGGGNKVFRGAGSELNGWDCGVFGGRAWVSSLPNFFLGNSFQFWKLPPYFCINSMDNVYYPIFLS